MSKEILFVYGTLRKGFGLHSNLTGRSRFLGTGIIQGLLYDLGPYPGAIPSTEGEIIGEVYELQNCPAQLQELDLIEGFHAQNTEQSLFIRTLTEVRMQNQTRLQAWVYYLPEKPLNAPRIPGGNYQ
jgi:gamma-glutamylcyclotransferase (GGCT)/AIG2-like uncharacterized protein YtfP